jgi:hypothetical protein
MHIVVPENGVLEIIRKVHQIKFFVNGDKKWVDVHRALGFSFGV